jgi:uncharacterized protein (TIGR02145 family)
MGSSPFVGWIQVGFDGNTADPLTLQPIGGNVGIGTGTNDPGAKLDVIGSLKVTDGTQGDGKILTSDGSGLASWQPPPPPPGTNDPSVSICCQRWMSKNLNVSTYRNGDVIPNVTDAAEWSALTTGAYCYYDNDSATYAAVYGKLYNWYAVKDSRGLAPEGWYIPTEFEYATLSSCLGGDGVAGGPLKETGTTHWASPNNNATNETGFTALPAGTRTETGSFISFSNVGRWWNANELDATNGWYRAINNSTGLFSKISNNKKLGVSVRCVRD